ncbi:MAG: L-2-hydroxyglutarate oxidase [Bacteroidetes bacterium]|jgi:L-2-hydroxyglutarate oxidase|nr:L-2-hydroxyglutarate oxidase [Bacteroidota bacterium]
MIYDLAVVGAGAVGLATAYQFQRAWPELKIAVLDKEPRVSAHQTGHNSGVIHAGTYYKPGSYKAQLSVRGRTQLIDFCAQHGVAYDICGKIIVATEEEELPRLHKIYATGQENGLTDIRLLDAQEIRAREPYCQGLQAVEVPYEGIVDFPGMCEALAAELCRLNPRSTVLKDQEVVGLQRSGDLSLIQTPQGTLRARWLIGCAGLQADRLARLDGLQPRTRIVGFRGDYYDLTPQGLHKVKHLIYPVPNPAFPFLGVHFTRMALGGVECGPNAVFVFKREGYGKTDFDARDTLDALSYRGTWALFARHWRFGLAEYRRAFSKRRFLRQLQRLIPSLTMEDLTPGRSGVRAMALGPDGQMVEDFAWETHLNAVHVLSAPSPAASACLAIGEEIRDKMERELWN